ncbi:hypothetical protein QA601_13295 [Chitinispirillales bacterium ANBcel5]|uniref:hypothetical protein n=1 Tax=Cellulosispirillum alkaliphilum TaxID=3039283 RepID=UPI002A4F2E27|nr:hypothetical protein [Chitinispirillales bacterium ANBcel5]
MKNSIPLLKKYKFLALILIIALSSFVYLFAGSSKQTEHYGESVPADAEVVALSDIISDPDQYHDKKVVMEGVLTGQCASLCKFNYSEGNDVTVVHLSGFKAPRLAVGTRVRIYSRITAGENRFVITTTGLELL